MARSRRVAVLAAASPPELLIREQRDERMPALDVRSSRMPDLQTPDTPTPTFPTTLAGAHLYPPTPNPAR